MSRSTKTRFAFRNDLQTAFGRIVNAGVIHDSKGVLPHPRVFGHYALVYLLGGSGSYCDASGYQQAIEAGDLIVIFPELAHTYGPGTGEHWAECHIIFDGPVFDLLRPSGLLRVDHPVYQLGRTAQWETALLSFVDNPVPVTPSAKFEEVCRLLHLLNAIGAGSAPGLTPPWREVACGLLETNLERELDLAETAGLLQMSYESFRKRFVREVGVAPSRYRAERRVEAACKLLRYTRMTSHEISEALGFSDEYHFSKRFKQITNLTPSAYRSNPSL